MTDVTALVKVDGTKLKKDLEPFLKAYEETDVTSLINQWIILNRELHELNSPIYTPYMACLAYIERDRFPIITPNPGDYYWKARRLISLIDQSDDSFIYLGVKDLDNIQMCTVEVITNFTTRWEETVQNLEDRLVMLREQRKRKQEAAVIQQAIADDLAKEHVLYKQKEEQAIADKFANWVAGIFIIVMLLGIGYLVVS